MGITQAMYEGAKVMMMSDLSSSNVYEVKSNDKAYQFYVLC